jgi:glutaryl-CoA dehydrogenase (non-decarboxylating)
VTGYPAPGTDSPELLQARREFRLFADEHLLPHAGASDRAGRLAPAVMDSLRRSRYLGAPLATDFGGRGMTAVVYGLLTSEVGRACSATRTLLTVHDLVGLTLQRWGSTRVKEEILPQLAQGRHIAAIALSEEDAGSNASAITTTLSRSAEGYILKGAKRWISFGQVADWFMVFARLDGAYTALMVPGQTPGLTRRPVTSMVSIRAGMMADLEFTDCEIRPEWIIGRPGFGLSHIAATAIDFGRYSVACGAVGIAEASTDISLAYTRKRSQAGAKLIDYQLVRARLTRMIAGTRAARLLCMRAGHLRDTGSPQALVETMIAKYFACQHAATAASDAVHLFGARGLTDEYPPERLLRDAKAGEIIEGSAEIHEATISGIPSLEI